MAKMITASAVALAPTEGHHVQAEAATSHHWITTLVCFETRVLGGIACMPHRADSAIIEQIQVGSHLTGPLHDFLALTEIPAGFQLERM